jgi:hypothetical protein
MTQDIKDKPVYHCKRNYPCLVCSDWGFKNCVRVLTDFDKNDKVVREIIKKEDKVK